MENVYIVAIAIGVIGALVLFARNQARVKSFLLKLPGGFGLSVQGQQETPSVAKGTRLKDVNMRQSDLLVGGEGTDVERLTMEDSKIDIGR